RSAGRRSAVMAAWWPPDHPSGQIGRRGHHPDPRSAPPGRALLPFSLRGVAVGATSGSESRSGRALLPFSLRGVAVGATSGSEDRGEGPPGRRRVRAMTAVFVHGVPETPEVWDPLVAALGRDDVARLQLPGFGCGV